MPVVALLRLVHFRVALLVLVLRRWGGSDQRCVDDGAFAHHQTLLGQMPVDGLENLAREAIRLQQMAKF